MFNRPQARNALTFAMYEELGPHRDRSGSLRALVITGAGEKAFAAGTDIGQFRAFSSAEDAIAYEARLDRVLGALERCKVPTIAAIAGACTGGGAGIAAACDLRIAAANARFGFPIARTLGNCLSMANVARLAALIGPARVTEIIFTARLLNAEEARAAGLVSEVLPDHPALLERAAALAQPGRRQRAADLARDQGSAAPPARQPAAGRGPDPAVLHQRRFPRGHGGVPQQARLRSGRGGRRARGHQPASRSNYGRAPTPWRASLRRIGVGSDMPAPRPHVMAGPDPAIDTGTIGPECNGTRLDGGGWPAQDRP